MSSDKSYIEIRENNNGQDYTRENLTNRKLNRIVFNKNENYFSIIIYIFEESRFTFQVYNDSLNSSKNEIYNAYDLDTLDLIIDYKVIHNRGERRHHQGYHFTREDLNYTKKIKDNFDVIKNYEETKEIFTSLNLFVNTYTENPFNLTQELNQERAGKALYAYLIQESMKEILGYTVNDDFMENYVLQNELAEKIIIEDQIPYPIKHIAGVSVVYNDVNQNMIASIVVMDIETEEIVDQAFFESKETTIHIPDLFAYNEVPTVLKAFEKLSIKPQLIFCDGHGIEHPRSIGLATHLGIELNIATIGCPRKRLVGYYDKEALGSSRADEQDLLFDGKIVGKAIRTQENHSPLYVSVGHQISLDTAIEWVLKTTQNTSVPIVIHEALKITNQMMPKKIRYDFLDDQENEYGILI